MKAIYARVIRSVSPFLFLALWLLIPFWRIAFLQAINVQDDIFASDLLNDRLPARAFVGESLRAGGLPFWIPGIYTGFPALAQVEIGTLYPPNLLLFGLLPPYPAVAYAQLLPLLIAGFGGFLLAREYRIPPTACVLAGGSLALSGFFVCHLRQLNMVDAAGWIPWLLLLAERMLCARTRWAPLQLAGVWALQLLAGHPQISYFTALVLVTYVPVRWSQLRRTIGVALLPAGAQFVLAISVGALVAGAQLVPAIELAALSHRQAGFTFDEATMFPASPMNFWTFFFPYINGDPANDTYRLSGLFWEQYGYLGLLPMLLAIIAIVVERRRPEVRFFAALGVVSYLLVLGKNTPLFYWVFQLVPGLSYFRFPTRFLVFVELSLALLSSFGLAHLLESCRGTSIRMAVAASILSLTTVDLWHHQRRQVPQVAWSDWTSPIGTVEFLRAQQARSPEPWRYYSLESPGIHQQVFHAARGWSGDLAPYVRFRAMLQPSFNLLHGLESPDGYANLVPLQYEAVWGSDKKPGIVLPSGERTGDRWRPTRALVTALRLFNVRYVLSAWPLASPDMTYAARSSEGVWIYEVARHLPRVFVVGEVVAAGSDEEALERMKSPNFDPTKKAIVHDPSVRLPPDAGSSTSARITRRDNLRVEVRLSLEHPGLLVISEGYYPGWRGLLDGVEVPIVRTNVMMRGVVVPAGDHEVVFEFRSASIGAGLLVSLVGLISLILTRKCLCKTGCGRGAG